MQFKAIIKRRELVILGGALGASFVAGCGDDTTGGTGGSGGGTGSGAGTGTGGGTSGGGTSGGGGTTSGGGTSGGGGTTSGGGSGGGTGGGGGGDMCVTVTVTIDDALTEHDHPTTIMASDVNAESTDPYEMGSGGAPSHQHEFELTAAQYETLFSTGSVTVTSLEDGTHTHPVTISCTFS